MVNPVAGGETSPFFEAKTANLCYFLHRYILSLYPASGVDCNTGPPSIDMKTQSALLCQEFKFQHISLDDILREKSDDQTYLHADFVKDCLRENVEVPRDLKICLLEMKINEGIKNGKKWSLVHGFPESIQEVVEFEEKVGLAATNKTLLTFFRCKKQITLCFSVTQLRCRSIVQKVKMMTS